MTSSDGLGLPAFYDLFFSDPILARFFGNSQYANFGFWTPRPATPAAACDQLVDLVIGQLPEPAGRVLEVACGRGASTNRLAQFADPDSLTAINVDPAQVDAARRLFPLCHFETMDATDLTFDDETFDQVVSVEAAFHFDSRERFLREAWRTLKPGGQLVMSDLLMAAGAPLVPAANHLAGLDAYRELLHRSGFGNVRIADITAQSWKPFRRAFTRFVARDPRSMRDPRCWRSLYTLNVNSAWAVRACVLVYAERALS
jgi:SAM-dependent methyltransferase